MRALVKAVFRCLGKDPVSAVESLSSWSVRLALRQQGLAALVARLREIEPDISNQEDDALRGKRFNAYWELKRRGLQAFQTRLLLDSLELLPRRDGLVVVDVGDSAGTHMLYLRRLAGQGRVRDTLSVNLEERAVEKVRARGFQALLCRAEELDVDGGVDLFATFEMVEHLHNPALFLRRLSRRPDSARLLLTVPYLERSRVGLHHVRNGSTEKVLAGDEHILELSPADWRLLFLHSGWRVVREETYYQYPRWLGVGSVLAWFWRRTDFEGFWGAVLEKDGSFADRYVDWEP
ncbi:MAG: hypothetical protein HY926_08945 [Elusimicrobia bacterium]|nr:hypothetical protein [Elusimicrobiota bacterium]